MLLEKAAPDHPTGEGRPDGPAPRGEVLALLAVALRPPADPGSLPAALEGLLDRLGTGQPRRSIEEAARRARDVPIAKEYHRLFLGPAKPLAPPFESVYRDGRLEGPATAAFRRELRLAGVEPPKDLGHPPDHIALEIECLALLEVRALEARRAGQPEEAERWSVQARRLVDRHLALWLSPFLARLEAAAPESPYTHLVRATGLVVGVPLRREAG